MVLARTSKSEGQDRLFTLADDLGLPRQKLLTYNNMFPSMKSTFNSLIR